MVRNLTLQSCFAICQLTMDASGRDGRIDFSHLSGLFTESAAAGATALETKQQLDDLVKAVDDALKGRRIIDADILGSIRKRRDEFAMECLPQALSFLREVQGFGIQFDNTIAAITQSLQDPNSSEWEVSFRNLGRDVDTIAKAAQTLHDALQALRGRLEGDEKSLTGAMKPDPNPDFKKEVQDLIVRGGMVAIIAVGIALAVATGSATFIVADGAFKFATGSAVAVAGGAGVCAGLLGGGAVGWYIASVKDAEAKLCSIKYQIQSAVSSLADLIGQWKLMKKSIQGVERKLGREVNRGSVLAELQQLKQRWHDHVITPALRLSIQE